MEDIRDIKGVVPVPHGWLWLAVLGVLLGLVLGVVWWRKRQPAVPGSAQPTPGPSPLEIALAALHRLREARLPVEEFYTQLSGIVRRYLEDQLQLRAPERTTEEFLSELAQGSRLSDDHKNLLGAFLQEADLVKFARHRPGQADMGRALAAAERFVRESVGQAARLAVADGDRAETGATPVQLQ